MVSICCLHSHNRMVFFVTYLVSFNGLGMVGGNVAYPQGPTVLPTRKDFPNDNWYITTCGIWIHLRWIPYLIWYVFSGQPIYCSQTLVDLYGMNHIRSLSADIVVWNIHRGSILDQYILILYIIYNIYVDPQIQPTFVWNQYPTHGNQQMHIWDWETRISVSHSISKMQGWFHDPTLWTGDSLEWQQFQKLPQHTKITPCFVIFTKFAHMYQKTCEAHALVKAHLRTCPKMQHHYNVFSSLENLQDQHDGHAPFNHWDLTTHSRSSLFSCSLRVTSAYIILNVGCVFMF